MSKSNLAKLLQLIKQYQYILWASAAVFVACLVASFWIYYDFAGHAREDYWFKVADFLRVVAETMVSTVLIGGVLGGVINFIFEERKKEEEAIEKRLLSMKESQERRKTIRAELRQRLQEAHDNVELARILIKSHRSGKTYGEQIRDHIMPANIALQDIKNQLKEIQEGSPIEHLAELQVSLTFMSAYLSVLIEEFSQHYLDIAMLQNYQDTVASRRRDVFTDIISETEAKVKAADDPRLLFIHRADQRMEKHDLPDRLAVVWEAMGRLDYVWDFIADLRDQKGKASRYQTFYIDHHFHALRLLRDKDYERNEKLCRRDRFTTYLKKLADLSDKKNSDQPITKEDSLTRMIMQEELEFEFGGKGQVD